MPMPGRPLQLPGPGPLIVIRETPETPAAGAAFTPVDPLGTSGFFGI